MKIARSGDWTEVNRGHWIIAEFRAEVLTIGPELRDDGGIGAEPVVQFFQRIVVDEIELHVLISPAFTRRGVGGSQQVKLSALGDGGLHVGLGRFRGVSWRCGGGRSGRSSW